MIIRRIVAWYRTHARDLPWRKTRDPYRILVSEVMLQQTQVERVETKYHEFLRTFPTVYRLANAKTADVIRAWAGLGYNRRALFLQRTAQAVVATYGEKFPENIDELKEFPGIGDYTARAILSFAFEKPVPVLDTNHRRFYQRVFFGMRKKTDKQLLKKAEEVVRLLSSTQEVYRWNQTLMDFGSLVCTTRNPECQVCPIQQWCKAYPAILKTRRQKKLRKKKSLPFEKTDRYVRGRIIDELREKYAVSLQRMRQTFPHVDRERFDRIIAQLDKDGLLVIRGGSILLP